MAERMKSNRAPRLIDLGLIKVLNETADNANMTMLDDNRQKIAIEIEAWAYLCGDRLSGHGEYWESPSDSVNLHREVDEFKSPLALIFWGT